MTTEQDFYLKILAYGLTDDTSIIPPKVDAINWHKFFSFCESQAILGIGLQSIDKLSQNCSCNLKIPQKLLFQWIGISEQIKSKNRLLNERTKQLTEYLIQNNKRSCILKGQGNALMYPNPFLRSTGDIDVWIEGSKKEIIDFVHRRYPEVMVEFHHMELPIFDDIEVEAHYYPSFCYNKWHNNRLQNYFRKESKKQFENFVEQGFYVPCISFNLVFQLSHMMRHFFTQGIGLRHVIDYYYLLRQNISEEQKRDLVIVLNRCGMLKFFSSILWIEREIFQMEVNYPIKLNKKAGKMILHEMLKGGNFGKKYSHNHKNAIINYLNQFLYNLRYIKEFPLEPISRPLSLTCDYIKRHVFRKL